MKQYLYAMAFGVVLLLSACGSTGSQSSSSSPSTSSQVSEKTQVTGEAVTREFEYALSTDQLSQTQRYRLTYTGDQYQQVLLTLTQSIPDASPEQLANPAYREEVQSVFEESLSVQEARELEGLEVTTSFNEAHQLVIVFAMDMTVLDLDKASQIEDFGAIFAGFKGTSPEAFISGLQVLGAKEIN